VAKQCIKYLRDQRVGTAHFLPLNTIRPREVIVVVVVVVAAALELMNLY